MDRMKNEELMNVQGGGIGVWFLIATGIVFIVGVIDGYVNPIACK